ncbi:multimerin-2a isoform X2 [Chiloscyllium plagiosum]|uniref:multimerin-2a isoform X2 n=1 Tax=Chiloscyllium plagiosum TaxID=36176 RepID=UPI001CB81C7B|nr:multimerin-2a isoform X2 [Chiloscyllium plagiosum]
MERISSLNRGKKMAFRSLIVFMCLRQVWLKKGPANYPGNGGKDFFREVAESDGYRGTQHPQGFDRIEGRADTELDAWGYEVVQGTNKPFSYVRTTSSDSFKRRTQSTVTNTRAPSKPSPGRNWCAFVKSKLSSTVVSCGVERFVQRAVEPCMNGMVNCPRVVYQPALRPMYKVKQMIVTSLEWKCCPEYTGPNCEHTVLKELVATGSLETLEGQQTIKAFINSKYITSNNGLQGSDLKLHLPQDDVSATTASTQPFQELLNNLSQINPSIENKENRTEFLALQDVLKTHVESYLRQHLHSLWTTFNKSFQDLSDIVLNLSKDIEVNTKNINGLLSQRTPQRELEEISTKLQSKLDENTDQVQKIKNMLSDQQQKFDYELHTQKVNLDHNLTMIKTETDLKVKRSQKIIQMKSHLLDNATAELKEEQGRLWQQIHTLNHRLSKITELKDSKSCPSCNSKHIHQVRGLSKQDFDHLRETIEIHSRNLTHLSRIFGLYHPMSKVPTDIEQQVEKNQSSCALLVAGLKREVNQKLNDTNIVLRENILRLNVSFNNQSSNQEEHLYNLDNDVKELKRKLYSMLEGDQICDCQNLIQDYVVVVNSLRNASNFMDKIFFDLSDLKQQELDLRINLNYSVQDLFRSLQQKHQDVQNVLYLHQKEVGTLTENIATLKKNFTMIMGEISHLKKIDATLDSWIKYLNSSFNSLLEDTLRHTVILQSVTGQDILEITSEDAPGLQKLSISNLNQNLNLTQEDLVIHKMILESINNRLHVLEQSNDKVKELIRSDHSKNVSRKNSSEIADRDHRSLEYMEPKYKAVEKEQMDDSKYDSNEISRIKKDFEILNLRVTKLEAHCNSEALYYNRSFEQIKQLIVESVNTVQSDVSSLKQHLDGHISMFQKLIGNRSNLFTNGTFRIGRGGFGSKRMRKQHRQSHEGNKPLGFYGNSSTVVNQINIPDMQESDVAFYVGLTNNSGTDLPLKFDQIFLNYGDGYSMEKGYFRAPLKGVYVFVATVEFSHGHGLGYLSVDGIHTITLHSSREKHQHNNLAWGYSILQLNKGQLVWIEVTQGIASQQTPPETTFGGFLLFKTF